MGVSAQRQQRENPMDEGAEEFLRLSFMRASFCNSLMNYAKDVPISKPEAYLMGMFSTLNYLIDAPMEEILKQIPCGMRSRRRCSIIPDAAGCSMT